MTSRLRTDEHLLGGIWGDTMHGELGRFDRASILADLGPLVAGTEDGDVTAVLSPAMDRLAGYAMAGILSDNVDRDGFPVLLVTDRTREFVDRNARKPLYVEDVILALYGRCDGAVRRDRVGFGTNDQFDGNRIGAMIERGMPLGPEEAATAFRLVADHAEQYARTNHPKHLRQEIVRRLKAGDVAFRTPPVAEDHSFRYACLSPGGREIWFFTEGDRASVELIKAMGKLRHGDRRARPEFEWTTLTVRGREREVGRWSVAMNGTTRAACLKLAKDRDFVVAAALEAAPDPKLDALRENQRFAHVVVAVRSSVRPDKARYVVLDLDTKCEPFSDAIKDAIDRRDRCCRPEDDWNWYVLATPENLEKVKELAKRFGFALSEELRDMLGWEPEDDDLEPKI